MPQHTVVAGDCILSIAEENGLLWETVWDHPENAQLKTDREDPNILEPGDAVFVPERRLKLDSKPTDKTHKYVKKGIPAKVRLRLLDWERKPRRNVPFRADVDGTVTEGNSDGDGMIEFFAKPNARQVDLTVTERGRTEKYRLQLGDIDPIGTVRGVQRRLENLGYNCGGEDGTVGEMTQAALQAFQKERDLEQTGEPDEATRGALLQLHGC